MKRLLADEEKRTANVQDLSYDFACRVVRLYRYLIEESSSKEYIMSKQLFRSGTSIGANVRESQHAQSDADFLTKISIAQKEAEESAYWVSLLHDNDYITLSQYKSLEEDVQRLLRLLGSISISTKKRINNKK